MIPSAMPGDHHTTTAADRAALTDQQLAVLISRLTYTPPEPDADPWALPDLGRAERERQRFMAAVVSDVPRLIAEVHRLRAALADYTHPIAHCFGCHHPAPWHIGELGSTERACTQHACGCTNLTREN